MLLAVCSQPAWAEEAGEASAPIPMTAAQIPTVRGPITPDTVITPSNWQQYKEYMPDGMQALFRGTAVWKMPADFQMVVGPTHQYSMPAQFNADTEKYSHSVKIVDLPGGGHAVTGYVAGLPFPNASGPQRGWKLLVDLWYVYTPYLLCGPFTFHLVDRFGNTNTETGFAVNRRLSHISDFGQPINDPQAHGLFYSQEFALMEPEQARYTTILNIHYDDPSKAQDTFIFIPAMRRALRLSSAARCSPFAGSDLTQDDAFKSMFNGDYRIFNSRVVREGYALALTQTPSSSAIANLNSYFKPFFFPKPSLGKWEARPVWVLDVRRIPSRAAGYCYEKNLLYLDKESYIALWKDGYDKSGHLWKAFNDTQFARFVPHVGVTVQAQQWFNNTWDMQNGHLTLGFANNSISGRPWAANEQCKNFDGQNYDDVARYSFSSGLSEILR
ncbi:MAG TPA: DUF1329 domain-containing protein [Candidatus Binataceae bacterium]|nr:DUF1329 domain-containing protein [Candidatus Binataceae bacterium]